MHAVRDRVHEGARDLHEAGIGEDPLVLALEERRRRANSSTSWSCQGHTPSRLSDAPSGQQLDVAAQAGHAPTMTLDTYAHVIEELEDGEKTTAEDAIYAARESDVPAMFPQTAADPNTTRPERR